MPTPTPRPDGATVHIVGDGDTLFGIALLYAVDADQIRELNASSLGDNDMIWPGQELVIAMPSQAPTPTPPPEPPTPGPESPAQESEVAEAPAGSPEEEAPAGGASVCVLAFHDRNGDSFQDSENEELLPNAELTLADASGVVDRYTSDGISEPHCFKSLTPGAYRVIQTSPPGYEPSGPAEWPVAVAEGTSLSIQFGNVRGEGSLTLDEEPTEPTAAGEEGDNPPSNSNSNVGNLFATVAKVSGVLVLILAAGVAVLFVLNRRRI
jgi:hypothetical protein